MIEKENSELPGLLGNLFEIRNEENLESQKNSQVLAERKDKVSKLLVEFKNEQPQRILAVLKACNSPLFMLSDRKPSDDEEYSILHIDEPDKIINAICQRINETKDGETSNKYLRKRAGEIWDTLTSLTQSLKFYSETFNHVVTLYAERDLYELSSDNLLRFPLIKPTAPTTKDGAKLMNLAKQIQNKADEIYNMRPVSKEDSEATPMNLFSIRRIRNFINELPNDESRRSYLLKINDAFNRQDAGGWITEDGKRSFKADSRFNFEIGNLINLYEKILIGSVSSISPEKQSTTNVDKDFTVRAKILLFLVLTYNKLELPIEMTVATIAKTVQALTGNDIGKIKKLLKNPTECKRDDTQSKKYLISDLRAVLTHLRILRVTENTRPIIAEIHHLLEDLKETGTLEDEE